VGGGRDWRRRPPAWVLAEVVQQNGPGTAGAGDDAEGDGEGVGAVDRKDGVVRHVANNRSGRPAIAKLQRAGVDGGAAGIRLVAGEDGPAGKHIDRAVAVDLWRLPCGLKFAHAVSQANGSIEKNWLRFVQLQLRIAFEFYSTRNAEKRSVSSRSSSTLVSVQLTQFWQHSSDGFSRAVRLL